MLVSKYINYLRRRYYYFLDQTIQYRKIRWFMVITLVIVYFYRVDGLSYYVITYLIGFYLLQLLSSYFTPLGLEND
jgi:hypothetical protein